MDTKLLITELFARRRNSEYTILQVAKLIDKSYGHINKVCRELIHEGLLNKKVVGNAILCTPNSSSDKMIGYLVLLSTMNKSFLSESVIKKASQITKENVFSIFYDSEINIVLKDGVDNSLFNFKTIYENELKLKQDFSNVKIIHGFENFWRGAYE